MIELITRSIRYRLRNMKAFGEYLAFRRDFKPAGDLILLFHGIDEIGSQKYNLRFTSQSDFSFIINALRRCYQISRLDELSKPSEMPRLVITFDDGYKNWKTHLLPLIEDLRINVTLFVTKHNDRILWTDQYDLFRRHCSSPVKLNGTTFFNCNGVYRNDQGIDLNTVLKSSGLETIKDFQRQAKIDEEILGATRIYWELLSDDDIEQLGNSEWLDIGSHACTHTSLDQLSDYELKFELSHSREQLSRLTGSAVRSIAFPSGRYDDRVVRFCREAKYDYLLAESLTGPADADNEQRMFERKGIYTIGSKYRQLMELTTTLGTGPH